MSFEKQLPPIELFKELGTASRLIGRLWNAPTVISTLKQAFGLCHFTDLIYVKTLNLGKNAEQFLSYGLEIPWR